MTSRRRFLRNTALAGAALAAPDLRATSPARRKIDCRTHFYDPTRPEGLPWPGKDTPLYRRVLPDDWMEVARPHQITDTVVVEASPWVEDNQFLLDLAAKDKRLLGIIGNLDPIWSAFGPDRLIYGSNWPVSDRGAPYGTVVGIVAAYFDEKGADVSDKFFAGNSRTAYRWQE